MIRLKKLGLTAAALWLAAAAWGQDTRFAGVFGDNMVLQRNATVSIWGYDTPNTDIKVSTGWSRKSYKTQTDASGKWTVQVETPEGSEKAYTVEVAGTEKVTLENVLIGEVWLCSGQSNMAWQLMNTDGGKEAAVNLQDYNMRYCMLPFEASLDTQDDVKAAWETSEAWSSMKMSAVAFHFGKMLRDSLQVPIGLIRSAYGGSSIKAWIDQESLSQYDFVTVPENILQQKQSTPTALYNTMLHPLLGYHIKGAIWYQGEADRSIPEEYAQLFPTMVDSWRQQWGIGDFPFYFVQLAPFDGPKDLQATFWNMQRQAYYDMDNSGMVSTLDLKSCDDIHPTLKKPVGDRLARWALANAYGYDHIVPSGPIARSASSAGGSVTVRFDFSESGLVAAESGLAGFELAGADGEYHPATAVINDSNEVVLSSSQVASPTSARYGYDYCPQLEATLFNKAGLPASAFELPVTN